MDRATLEGLLKLDTAMWLDEVNAIRAFYDKFGAKLPETLSQELSALEARLH